MQRADIRTAGNSDHRTHTQLEDYTYTRAIAPPATMPPRPSLSISMPPGLDIFSNQGDNGPLPKIPEQQHEEQNATQPPPPPRQAMKIKRKRHVTPLSESQHLGEPLFADSDTVIPTIEMSEPVEASPEYEPTSASKGLLSPMPVMQRLFTPPKTPAPRVDVAPESPAHEWDLINDSRTRPSFERSGSVCSSFSDSSVSSCGSSGFSAPNGSCASPESVATDPFMEEDMPKGDKYIISPDRSQSQEPTAKRIKKHRHVKWTQEMDTHLEATYMQYVKDPRVTPFKMLPGVAPPLGVCSRVAAKARRTWSTSRAGTPTPLDTIVETAASNSSNREGTPETIRPSALKDIRQPQWPRSDAATRRRLRKLVKSKPKLSAYYTRLMRMRSPSPFSSSNASARSSEPPSSAFSGRDMKLSLITSTAPSMQPEGPLAQLSSDDTALETSRPQSQRQNRPSHWFDRIPRSKAHQKSLSLQSELSLQNQGVHPAPLDSPFDEASNRSHLLQSMANTKSLGRSEFKDHAKKPSLDSPFEMSQGAPTAPRSLKRRFKSDEEKPRRPVLEDVFGPSQQSEDAGGIVRNRGFTVGAVRANDNLAKLFEPPPPPMPTFAKPSRAQPATPAQTSAGADQEMTEAPRFPDLGPIGSRSAPRRLAEPVPRLGSPFMESLQASRGQQNTFPRSYIPSNANPAPFHQRLRELVHEHQQTQP